MIDIKAIENLIHQSYEARSGLLAAKYAIKQKSLKYIDNKEKAKKVTKVQTEQIEKLTVQVKKKEEFIDHMKMRIKIKEANREEDDKHEIKLTIKTLKTDVHKLTKDRQRVLAQFTAERTMLADVRQEKAKLEDEAKQMMKDIQEKKKKINTAQIMDSKKELDTTATKKPQQKQGIIKKEVVKKDVSQDIRSKGEMKLNSKFVGVHITSAEKQTKKLNTNVHNKKVRKPFNTNKKYSNRNGNQFPSMEVWNDGL